MTVFEAVDVKPEARIKRDRWGRYEIPHPVTGKTQSWTRATTLASTLADRFGLEQWSKRNVVLGIGARVDLYAQAAAALPEDKDTLNQIVAQAEEASKAKAGANTGSALHRFTERADAGEDVQAPAPWDADLAAYRSTMNEAGLTVVAGWLERVLLVPEVDVAGTCDRLLDVGRWGALPRIGDLKTAKNVVRYGMTEIALQLSLYAHATHWFDPDAGELHKIDVKIDQERAIVMHLPVGQGRCTLYEVDIAAGWDAVRLAVDVRNWRKRKDLCAELTPARQGESAFTRAMVDGGEIPATVLDSTTGNPTERQTLSEPPVQAPSRENGDQPATGSDGGATAPESTPVAGPAPDTEEVEERVHMERIIGDEPPTPAWLNGQDVVEDQGPELLAARREWLRGRVDAIKAAGHAATLARNWSEHDMVPTFPKGGPTTAAEMDVVSQICWDTEGAHGMAFPPSDDPAIAAFEAEAKAKGLV